MWNYKMYFEMEFLNMSIIVTIEIFCTNSDGVKLAMRICCTGPWHKLSSRYAQAVIDDNTINHRLRWI